MDRCSISLLINAEELLRGIDHVPLRNSSSKVLYHCVFSYSATKSLRVIMRGEQWQPSRNQKWKLVRLAHCSFSFPFPFLFWLHWFLYTFHVKRVYLRSLWFSKAQSAFELIQNWSTKEYLIFSKASFDIWKVVWTCYDK